MIRRIFFVSTIILACLGLYSFIYAPTRKLEWDRYSCWMDSGLQILVQMPEVVQKLTEKEASGTLDNFQKELQKILRRLKKSDKTHKVILAGKKGPSFEHTRGLSRLLQIMIDKPILISGQVQEHDGADPAFFIETVMQSVFGFGNKIFDMGNGLALLASGNNEKKYAKLDTSEFVNQNISTLDEAYCVAYLDFDERKEDFKKKSYIPLTLELGGEKYELFALLLVGKLLNLTMEHATVMVKQEDETWWYFNDLEGKREQIDFKTDLDMHKNNGIEYIKIFSDKFSHILTAQLADGTVKRTVYGTFFGETLFYRKVGNPLQKSLNQLKQRLTILKDKLLSLRTQLENLRNELGK